MMVAKLHDDDTEDKMLKSKGRSMLLSRIFSWIEIKVQVFSNVCLY
jgi:hypothetical protein